MTTTATIYHDAFWSGLRPQRVRSIRQFAEQEFIIPTGPRAGLNFRSSFMPWTGLLLDLMGSGKYRRMFGSGPAQSGKTLLFFQIPALYHLFEIGEPVILGAPDIEMAQDIFRERLMPVIERTRYRDLLPASGAGSRGGRFRSIRFGNGAVLRFMGAGGSDAQRSSHTARVIILTEIDKMDTPGQVSREADPVTQLEARAQAYGSQARIYAECTMSIETGRVYQEVVKFGTHTRIYVPCPHCGEYVVPDREHFLGWRGADTIIDARREAHVVCKACGAQWTDADRRTALTTPVLADRGQTVLAGGKIDGDPPETDTLGFVWCGLHSAMMDQPYIAEREWRAEQSENPNDKRGVVQFIWAEPWREGLDDISGVTRDVVLSRIGRFERGVIPDQCKKLTVFIDLGLYRCWWSAWAWAESARGYLIDYGCIEVPQERKANPLAILTSLRTFRDDVLIPGWTMAGGDSDVGKSGDGGETSEPREPREPRVHDLCLIDAGYQPDIAKRFVVESGQGRYFASEGMGTARNEKGWRRPKEGKDRVVADNWALITQTGGVREVAMHSDYWKAQVHTGLRADAAAPGSLQIFKMEKAECLQLARHLTAERLEREFKPGIGERTYWNRLHRDNHWFDCAYGCRCAADMLGVKLITAAEAPKKKQVKAPTERKIRTKY